MDIVTDSLIFCSKKYDADILAFVLMPNHIHFIVYFTEANKRIDFMRDFKKFTSTKVRQEIEKADIELLEIIRINQNGQVFKVWQDRFDEVFLESRELLEIKLNYIHNNPLQPHWKLSINIEDYFYSSASFYEKGIQNKIEVKHYLDYF
ncbi:MAG: transposase [Bacteroidetes bacterium]|nr:transposase [Bacteroidota bacterium]